LDIFSDKIQVCKALWRTSTNLWKDEVMPGVKLQHQINNQKSLASPPSNTISYQSV